MTALRFWQVDAFAEGPFTGNPAVVCLTDDPLDAGLMQQIACEFNQSETAFVESCSGQPAIRWFTPSCEVTLCGHATLAAGAVWLNQVAPDSEEVSFSSQSGALTVTRAAGALFELSLPLQTMLPCPAPEALERGLGLPLREVYEGPNYLVVLADESEVLDLRPDMAVLASMPDRGCIVTAPGDRDEVDFVSRYFAPAFGIDEDPVTGSAHCMLVPYWAGRLQRQRLSARQLSSRGGELLCRLDADRVMLAGHVNAFSEGRVRF